MLIERHEKPKPPPPARVPFSGPKPALPMIQLPIFRVKMADLEQYLFKVYRTEEFDFLGAAGLKAGECPEYVVQAALPAAGECVRKAEYIRGGGYSKNVPLILNVLCIDGFIPSGKYVIDTHPQPKPFAVYTALMKQRLDGTDPDCVAFKKAYQHDREFTKRAERLDKAVAEAVQREQELIR